MIDHEEIAARRRYAADPSIAAFFWQVRRIPDEMTQAQIQASEVLISEYDASGILHRLSEIKVQPPYLWFAEAYRAIESQYIPIPRGYEPIWEHRVFRHVCILPPEHPDFMPQWYEDRLIFGRRNRLTGAEEILRVCPDGSKVEFSSLADARAL